MEAGRKAAQHDATQVFCKPGEMSRSKSIVQGQTWQFQSQHTILFRDVFPVGGRREGAMPFKLLFKWLNARVMLSNMANQLRKAHGSSLILVK